MRDDYFDIYFILLALCSSISLDKGHYATTRVQRLVSAFTERARALKERIAQPATPSTDASSQGFFLTLLLLDDERHHDIYNQIS